MLKMDQILSPRSLYPDCLVKLLEFHTAVWIYVLNFTIWTFCPYCFCFNSAAIH